MIVCSHSGLCFLKLLLDGLVKKSPLISPFYFCFCTEVNALSKSMGRGRANVAWVHVQDVRKSNVASLLYLINYCVKHM